MINVKMLLISFGSMIAYMKKHALLVINFIINIVSDVLYMNVYNVKVIGYFHIVNASNILQQQKITYMIAFLVL